MALIAAQRKQPKAPWQEKNLTPPGDGLASLNRRTENVRVEAVVIAELKLRDVQRHILLADLVECADNTALDDRPEALNGVGVDSPDNVFALGLINGGVRIAEFARGFKELFSNRRRYASGGVDKWGKRARAVSRSSAAAAKPRILKSTGENLAELRSPDRTRSKEAAPAAVPYALMEGALREDAKVLTQTPLRRRILTNLPQGSLGPLQQPSISMSSTRLHVVHRG